jgi:hypothetical protein
MPAGVIDVFRIRSGTRRHLVVPLTDPPDEKWAGRVAAGLKHRVVLVWAGTAGAGLRCVTADKKDAAPTDEERALAEEVSRTRPPASAERIDGVYLPSSIRELIQDRNDATIRVIVNSILSPTGLIPFVGAGMSFDYGVPMWGPFLNVAAESDPARTDDGKKKIAALVKMGKYETAAQLLNSESPAHFRDAIRKHLDVSVDASRTTSGALSILPLLTSGPVITTNFDRVLEAFYEAAERPFPEHQRIFGPKASLIIDAIQQNGRILIKLHGDVREPDTFTFTALQYETNYGNLLQRTRGDLTKLGNVVYTNRPLLFLGCSLEKDRTLKVLREVARQNPYLRHYAVLEASVLESAMAKRLRALEKCAVTPLWFSPGGFGEIRDLLDRLLKDSSTEDLLPPAAASRPTALPVPSLTPEAARSETAQPAAVSAEAVTSQHLKAMAAAIASGQMLFFLGARAHDTGLSGNEMYARIADSLGVPHEGRNRADVAEQFIATAGRDGLSQIIARILADHFSRCGPSPVHSLIANLVTHRATAALDQPVVVVTTNYDDVLEKTIGVERCHVFLYQTDGPHAGRFVHRDGRQLRVIRNPEGVYSLPLKGAVVVKMNGGLDPLAELPGRFTVAPWDFIELANRLPGVLPAAVRKFLDRSLLFLGHGMAEPDVRAFGRYARQKRGVRPAWAIQRGAVDVSLWRKSYGVDILESEITVFLDDLRQTLRQDFQIDA